MWAPFFASVRLPNSSYNSEMEERQLHKFVAQEKCENHETKQYALDLHQSAVSKISRDNHSIRTAH